MLILLLLCILNVYKSAWLAKETGIVCIGTKKWHNQSVWLVLWQLCIASKSCRLFVDPAFIRSFTVKVESGINAAVLKQQTT